MRQEYRQRIADKIRREAALINPFLDDENVVEVMLNADGSIWTDRMQKGQEKTDVVFPREQALLFMGSVAIYNDTSINASSPLLKASLPWGQRFEGIIEPVVTGPTFAIRCNRACTFSLDDYVPKRMTHEMAETLRAALKGHKNILVSGGTGSGKTTLTTALLQELSELCPDDRLVVMEDTREITLKSRNVVYLKTSDEAHVTMCDLLASTLRLRPDRIIVGELRGKEALDLLKAWNTGHPGGVCTLHANSAESALARFESLILEAQNLSIPYIRSLVADAVDVIVHIQRDKKMGPVVSEIVKVNGMNLNGEYKLEELINNSPKEEE